MTIRRYDNEKDFDAARRIWLECGWLEGKEDAPLKAFLECATAWVGELDGEAETLVLNIPATVRHMNQDLPLAAVAAVTTSRVARKQGLAGRATVRAIAHDANEGALVAALGMFEQGYYNKLGFGTLAYEHELDFDPGTLRLPSGYRARAPKRLTNADFEKAHANRLTRRRGHGACSILPSGFTKAGMEWKPGGFGLGYYDGPEDTLSHHLWCSTRGKDENGPYRVDWMAFETNEQFLELLALLKGLGDQVRLVRMFQPPGIMLQDFLSSPFHRSEITKNSEFSQKSWFAAWQQARMLDVVGCLERTNLPGAGNETVRFNLELHDPIETLLDTNAPSDSWFGVSGSYIVTLGASCGAEKGRDGDLPTLESSVNAFTRLWMGVCAARALTMTEHFAGPRELIERLDEMIRLPVPETDWQF